MASPDGPYYRSSTLRNSHRIGAAGKPVQPPPPVLEEHLFDAVIFDCDGVLIDSESISNRVFVRELARIGIDLDLRRFSERFAGVRDEDVMDAVRREHDVDPPPGFFEHVMAEVDRALGREVGPVPGVAEALDRLALPKAVASNSPAERLRLSLAAAGLMRHFDPELVFSADAVGRPKPDPALYRHAAAALGVAPARCLVVEDSEPGARAGVAAGMTVWGFLGTSRGGDHAVRLRGAGAVRLIPSMRELGEAFAAT